MVKRDVGGVGGEEGVDGVDGVDEIEVVRHLRERCRARWGCRAAVTSLNMALLTVFVAYMLRICCVCVVRKESRQRECTARGRVEWNVS